MGPGRGARRVPGRRVGGGGVGEDERAVHPELDAGHADVVRGGGGKCDGEPETVAPVAGAVIATVGAVVSPASGTVTLTVETELLPAAS